MSTPAATTTTVTTNIEDVQTIGGSWRFGDSGVYLSVAETKQKRSHYPINGTSLPNLSWRTEGGKIGYYLTDTTTIEAGQSKKTTTTTGVNWKGTTNSISLKHLQSFGNSHVAFTGSWQRTDDGASNNEDNRVSKVGITYYPTQNLGLSLSQEEQKFDDKNAASWGWNNKSQTIGVNYFLNSKMSMAMNSTKADYSNRGLFYAHEFSLTSRF